MKNLVIVESPSKSHTIEKYLGKDYKVLSSKGHIRTLSNTGKYGLGIDIDNDFKPNYIVINKQKKLVSELKKEVSSSDFVILATDPDREGEAISWHLKETLGVKKGKYGRVVFNEITEPAIKEAFKEPRNIDDELVNSQEARMMLDKIIGFRLSKILQNKKIGRSAGRVQSVALKLIVDREREIQAFIPEEYYTIVTDFNDFKAELKEYNNKKIEIKSVVEADEILEKLSNAYNIVNVEKANKKKPSKLPFTTSTLTQMASNRLGYPAKKTMSIAQKLYEGINIGSETVGLISYMRTDSIRLSDLFIEDTKKYITSNYGKEYVGYAKQAKSKENIQDAHEAIRPTSIFRTPESIKKYLKPDEYKLYNLIYVRTLASLMADEILESTSIELENKGYIFKANGQVVVFDGYSKVYGSFEDSEENVLPDFTKYNSKVLVSDKVSKVQHFTEPKPRYTEARLIQEMEKLGIGRPSTYALIIEILTKTSKYVNIKDKKLYPNEDGIKVSDILQEFFSSIINVDYTANMENDLDIIANGNLDKIKLLKDFYKDFEPLVDNAFKGIEKALPESTGEVCPNCGSELVIRDGKYGKFVACSSYPSCKYIKKEEKEIIEICSCPKCNNKIIEKRTKKGKIFYGCNNYPKCKYALWDKPTGEICSKCNELLVEGKNGIMCPNCDKSE